MTEKKQPEKKFRAGAVTATVWKNVGKTKDGREFDDFSTTLERSYKDGEEWKTTNSYKQNDLPKVALVSNLAYKFIAMKEEK